jgi:hypothetical protein
MPNRSIRILGTPVACVTYDSALKIIKTLARQARPTAVCPANTHILAEARHSPDFARVMAKFDLVLPDGMPVVWTLNQCGAGLSDRVYGPYFMRHVLKNTPRPWRHFFFGDTAECLVDLRRVVADPMNSSKAPVNWFQVARDWATGNPLAAALLLTIVATLVYFFGFVKLFTNESLSAWIWACQAWNPETNCEHAKIIPIITIFWVWHARNKLKVAPVSSSRWGWLFIGVGLFLFVAGARTVQARLALPSLPFLLFGILCVWAEMSHASFSFQIDGEHNKSTVSLARR